MLSDLNETWNFLDGFSKNYQISNLSFGNRVVLCKGSDRQTDDDEADKSLARPTSRCILFASENISFDASLVIYINSTNIPPIMIINRIYETQNLLSL